MMPDGFPPWRRVHCWFARLRDDGAWEVINQPPYHARSRAGRARDQSDCGSVDNQSVKTTKSGGIGGYDAGKTGFRLCRLYDNQCSPPVLDIRLTVEPVRFTTMQASVHIHHAHYPRPVTWRFGAPSATAA